MRNENINAFLVLWTKTNNFYTKVIKIVLQRKAVEKNPIKFTEYVIVIQLIFLLYSAQLAFPENERRKK